MTDTMNEDHARRTEGKKTANEDPLFLEVDDEETEGEGDAPKELSVELLQKFTDLVEHGKIVGTVTDEEIFAIVKPDTDAYDELMKRLDDADIDIVAGEELGELKDSTLEKKDDVGEEIEDFIDALDDEEDFANYASELDAADNPDSIEDAIKSKDIDQTLENDLATTFSDDPVKMYLREIGQVDRLTALEEVTLSQKVQDGLRAREELKRAEDHNLPLTDERRQELNDLADDGMDARNDFIEANLRLVVFIAKRYQGRGMQFQDLIQEGNLGLIKAVNKYDATKGFKFATYATWWIKQSITRAIADQARTIRIPVHMVETINKLVRTQRRLTGELHREPSTEELADEMGITIEKVQMIQKIAQEPVSLEKPVGEEEDSTLGDFVSDQDSLNPLEYTESAKFKEAVDYLLKTLTPREEQVLRLRFGLVDGKQHTLEEVGREFHVTRERIRQIEAKAIRRLRHPTRQKIINQYR